MFSFFTIAADQFDVFGDDPQEEGGPELTGEDQHLEAQYEDDNGDPGYYEDRFDPGLDLPDEDERVCEGHESLDGPIGNVTFCDGSCNP